MSIPSPGWNTPLRCGIFPRGKAHFTPGDKPEHLGGEAGSIGIIGGADGPTAVFITSKLKKEEKGLHAAFSALRYQPVDRVEWEFIFREKTMEDLRVSLL